MTLAIWLTLANRAFGAGTGQQHLAARYAKLMRLQEFQALAYHPHQAIGELRADIRLDIRREGHADAAQALRTGGGMHGREHEMTRFCGIQRQPNDLGGAHLADHQHIRILAQGIDDGLLETR